MEVNTEDANTGEIIEVVKSDAINLFQTTKAHTVVGHREATATTNAIMGADIDKNIVWSLEMTNSTSAAASPMAPPHTTTTYTAAPISTDIVTVTPMALTNVVPKTPKPKPSRTAARASTTSGGELQRRSSSRSIKRKRFDDEIVEYSIGFQQSRGESHRVGRPRSSATVTSQAAALRQQQCLQQQQQLHYQQLQLQQQLAAVTTSNAVFPPIITPSEYVPFYSPASTPTSTVVRPLPETAAAAPVATARPQFAERRRNRTRHANSRRRTTTRSSRRSRKNARPVNPYLATKDLGRWKPADDLALINGVLQTNDLRVVHRGITFSCKFTLQEVQNRWASLLYDPSVSRIAVAAMRNIHPEQREAVERNALFSVQEEEMLGTIKSTDSPKLTDFEELLNKNMTVFYHSRTPKILHHHWLMLKQYYLLPDQIVRPLHCNDEPLSFSDAEELIVDSELMAPRDEALEHELELADRQAKKEIRLLEAELTRWNVLVDSITGIGIAPEFDGQTLAILRGHLVRYLMRSKEITFGRDAKDLSVDVDLSLEGAAYKISRRQGTIKLRSNGDFFIANEGKRPIFINGVPLLKGAKTQLGNNFIIEICDLKFVFLINYDLINAIRHESAKTTSTLK